jgi:hypothetical protein
MRHAYTTNKLLTAAGSRRLRKSALFGGLTGSHVTNYAGIVMNRVASIVRSPIARVRHASRSVRVNWS